MNKLSNVLYAILFQLGWFVCILTSNFFALIYTLIFLTLHLWWLSRKTSPFLWPKEISWLALVTISGFLVESLFFSAGFLYSQDATNLFEHFHLPPLWLLCLWLMFSIALRTCLAFLFLKPQITYWLTLIVVPINYYYGAELNGEVHINRPYFLSFSLIALIWVSVLWCLVQIKIRYFEDIFQ